MLLFSDDSDGFSGIADAIERDLGRQSLHVIDRVELTQAGWPERSTAPLHREPPTGVVVAAESGPTVEVLRHLKTNGYAGRILTASAFDDPAALAEAGELAEGVFVLRPAIHNAWSDHRRPAPFSASSLGGPTALSSAGYDAARLAILALTATRSRTTAEMKLFLAGEINMSGPSGVLERLSDDRRWYRCPVAYVVHRGRLQLPYPRAAPDLSLTIGTVSPRRVLPGSPAPTPPGR